MDLADRGGQDLPGQTRILPRQDGDEGLALLVGTVEEDRSDPVALVNRAGPLHHSLIDGLEPGVDHGWLAIHEGRIAVSLDEHTAGHGDSVRAHRR